MRRRYRWVPTRWTEVCVGFLIRTAGNYGHVLSVERSPLWPVCKVFDVRVGVSRVNYDFAEMTDAEKVADPEAFTIHPWVTEFVLVWRFVHVL